MDNGEHEVLVLERGQHLFAVKPCANSGGDGNVKHEVLVLEKGQHLFIVKTMREQWW